MKFLILILLITAQVGAAQPKQAVENQEVEADFDMASYLEGLTTLAPNTLTDHKWDEHLEKADQTWSLDNEVLPLEEK